MVKKLSKLRIKINTMAILQFGGVAELHLGQSQKIRWSKGVPKYISKKPENLKKI